MHSSSAQTGIETFDYSKVKAVVPLDDYRLQVTFANGVSKVYDCKPLLRKPTFAALSSRWLFRVVQVDPGGYGVSWNEDIDSSEFELWERGTPIEPTLHVTAPT